MKESTGKVWPPQRIECATLQSISSQARADAQRTGNPPGSASEHLAEFRFDTLQPGSNFSQPRFRRQPGVTLSLQFCAESFYFMTQYCFQLFFLPIQSQRPFRAFLELCGEIRHFRAGAF